MRTAVRQAQVPVSLPSDLLTEVEDYARAHDADVSWTLRRAARYLLDGEHEQRERLAEIRAERLSARRSR